MKTNLSNLLVPWLAALVWLGLCSLPKTSAALQPDQADDPNFSGTWALDLKGSTSFEPLMKQMGASFLERTYAASVTLKATLHQTETVMTIAARGPGFAFDEIGPDLLHQGFERSRSFEVQRPGTAEIRVACLIRLECGRSSWQTA